MTDMELMSKIHKQLVQPNIKKKKQNTLKQPDQKMGRRSEYTFFPNKTYRRPATGEWKDVQGRSQDGGGIGPGDHFLFYKFIKRTTERWTKFTKQLLIASSGHQAPRKAAQCLRREGKKICFFSFFFFFLFFFFFFFFSSFFFFFSSFFFFFLFFLFFCLFFSPISF